MILYDYYRSSAAYRVRIALNLKGLSYQQQSVNLLAAENREAPFLAQNPQGLVPVLKDNGELLSQSLAICEYLDEQYPQSMPLVYGSPVDKANIRRLAQIIACDIHPVDNLRVLKYLQSEFNIDEQEKLRWYQHWIAEGFTAFEAQLKSIGNDGPYCYGDQPSLADICLIPQLYNAKRFEMDLSEYPILLEIDRYCNAQPEFARAHPDSQ